MVSQEILKYNLNVKSSQLRALLEKIYSIKFKFYEKKNYEAHAKVTHCMTNLSLQSFRKEDFIFIYIYR